ncbi:MAG: hypothetical protein CYPHOPRED_000752 [Cyphobasidiales sp. Tagirdzhanova-0007]|nr:MAG: hypothetical protein CYPHOPRED_000752 [Cyphobasidiales sp. Tagirdzhanova-0007]
MPRIAIYAAGSNSHGQLGIGNDHDAHKFTQCPIDYTLNAGQRISTKIVAGANHTLLLLNGPDKQVLFVAGSSERSQLGLQTEDSSFTFIPLSIKDLLPTLSGENWSRLPTSARNLQIKDVAAGWETSFILLESRRDPLSTCILAMGANEFGQLAKHGSAAEISCLIPLSCTSGIGSIISGPCHTVAMDKKGLASSWGSARHGQLDHLNILSSFRPKKATLVAFTGTRSFASIALGHQHSILVSSDQQRVYGVGSNKKGQLGSKGFKDGCTTLAYSGITSTSAHATWSSTFLLQHREKSSVLISFGNNAHGQLGRDQAMFGSRGEVAFPLFNHSIVQLSAGSEHVLAIVEADNRREVWGWGWNEHGNLGLGENLEDVRKPTKIWTSSEKSQVVQSVHAGNGTSWIVVLEDG